MRVLGIDDILNFKGGRRWWSAEITFYRFHLLEGCEVRHKWAIRPLSGPQIA